MINNTSSQYIQHPKMTIQCNSCSIFVIVVEQPCLCSIYLIFQMTKCKFITINIKPTHSISSLGWQRMHLKIDNLSCSGTAHQVHQITCFNIAKQGMPTL